MWCSHVNAQKGNTHKTYTGDRQHYEDAVIITWVLLKFILPYFKENISIEKNNHVHYKR